MLLAGLVFLAAAGASHGQVANRTVVLPGESQVGAEVFSVPARAVRMQVVSTMQLKRLESPEAGVVSLQSMAQASSMRSTIISRPRASAFLILAAGSTPPRSERPEGLLLTGGKANSIPDYSRSEPGSDSCAQKRGRLLKLGGLLCVRTGGAMQLSKFSADAVAGCVDAMQLGPLLVDDGERAICPSDEARPAQRAAACTAQGADGAEVHHFVVTREPVAMVRFADWLRLPVDKGGLGCRIAVNLSEEGLAGAAFFGAKRSALRNPNMVLGNSISPQPAFLTVTTR